MAEAAETIDVRILELVSEAGARVEDLDQRCQDRDLRDLAYLCDPWELIGHHLDLSYADISAIKEDNPRAEIRRLKVLKRWKETNLRPTFKVLIKAFLNCGKTQQALIICERVKQLGIGGAGRPGTHQVSSSEQCNLLPVQMPSRNSVQSRIQESMRRLNRIFSDVQTQFMKVTGLTLDKLKSHVATLESFKCQSPTRLFRSENIHEFFHYLKDYCNAQSHDILEDLIKLLGDDETKRKMSDFKMEYKNFQRRTKLKDFVGNYEGPETTPPDYKELEIKLGENWHEKTLEDLANLQCQISLKAWLLKKIEEGSLIVKYLVPDGEKRLPLQRISDYLREQNVLSIRIDGKNLVTFSEQGN